MDYILTITTGIALAGAYLNSIGDSRSFIIWIVTNIVFVVNNIMIEQYEQAFLFGCYLILAANGLRYSLKKKVKA